MFKKISMKNINFFISWLDNYSIWSDNVRQLEAIYSHRSQLLMIYHDQRYV